MERTLQQAKDEKELEIRQAAEDEFWQKFRINDWDIPIARILQGLARAQTGGQTTQQMRDRLVAGIDVVTRLDSIVPQIRNATTVQQVDAFRWTPTPTP